MLTDNDDEDIGGFWRRFWAYLIDLYAVMGILMPIGYITFVAPREIAFLLVLSTTFSGVIYFVYTHYKYGQSVGKISLGLKVQTLSKTPLSLQQSISRYIVDALFPAVTMFIFISAMFSIPYEQYLMMTVSQRIFLFSKNFIIMMAIAWSWLTLNAIPLLFNDKKRSIRDFIGSTYVVKLNKDSHYPKKKIFFLLLTTALGQAFMNKSLAEGYNILFLILSLIMYCTLLYLVICYTRAAVNEQRRS